MITKLLLFGITGDLSTRKLLPSLKQLFSEDEFKDNLSVIGISRRDVDVAALLASSIGSDELKDRFSVVKMDLDKPEDYVRLKQTTNLQPDEQAVIYLSVPPEAAGEIVELLGEAGLNTPNVKLMFEKPFGVDLASAEETIARTAHYFKEEQVYRIDHYAAKEMAQNIIPLRMGSALLSQLWNKESIEKIEIVAYEQLTIGERATFYEQVGALRDLIQGHLMQLLALTLMDISEDYDWDALPSLRLQALQDLEAANPALAHRAQYEGYRQAADSPESTVETFASVELQSGNPIWQGVPITLATGKSLSTKTSEIRLHLRPTRAEQSTILTIRIQPHEGVETELMSKQPGYDQVFTLSPWTFAYGAGARIPDAYEQVFVSAIRGEKSLFTSADEVLRSWELLAPIQRAWNASSEGLPIYPQGSEPTDVIAAENDAA